MKAAVIIASGVTAILVYVAGMTVIGAVIAVEQADHANKAHTVSQEVVLQRLHELSK